MLEWNHKSIGAKGLLHQLRESGSAVERRHRLPTIGGSEGISGLRTPGVWIPTPQSAAGVW